MITASMRSTHSAVRRAALAAAFVAPWGFIAESWAEEKRAKQTAGLIGLVGHWSAVTDGGPALKADGEAWTGQTERSRLEPVARKLFPQLSDTFLVNGTAPGAFPLATHAEVADFSGGTIRVQFKLVGGRSDQTAGIVVGLGPSGEYMFLRYNTRDGNVAMWGYAGGERRVIAHGEQHAQLPLNQWHELAVTVSGLKITGVVNDSLRVDHTLAEPLKGRVGLWTKRDAVTVFRNFRVTR
jgi:hypothetical protein